MGKKTDQLLYRAKANLEQEEHENALRLYNQVLNREPSHLQALQSKALIKISTGKPQEAEEFLKFAIKQQPDDDQLHQMLGTFYLNNKSPQKALDELKRALKLNPSNDVAHHGLGLLFSQVHGQHKKAVAHFTKAIEISQSSADTYFNRGCSYMILKQMEKAEQDLRKAVELGHSKAKEMVEEYFK